MKYTYLVLIAICLFCFSSCTSTKEEKKAPVPTLQSTIGQEKQVSGTLEQSASGSYVIHTGAGKSIATWHLVSSDSAPEAYSQLANYVGKTVKVSGVIVEQKSAWNTTLGVTAVE